MKPTMVFLACVCFFIIPVFFPTYAESVSDDEFTASSSPHMEQTRMMEKYPPLPTEDDMEAKRLEEEGRLFPEPAPLEEPAPAAAAPAISDDFIVFGYIQNESVVYHLRWQALTHIGSLFVNFDSSGYLTNPGNFTGRSSYLKAGGAADAAGVKVVMVVRNSGFDVSVINSVMTNATYRDNLIDDIVSVLSSDGYSHGVSFDFEPFSWTSSARDGMTTFFSDLRAEFDAVNPDWEISLYADPTPSSTQFDLAGFTPNLNYYTYSCYDWATGNTAHAISDFDNYISQINNFYLSGGVPAEKMVITISSYSRRWTDTNTYNGTGSSSASQGFTDGLYDTTLNPNYGGPYTNNYVTGDECGWHTWNESGTDYTRTWEALEGIEYKVRHVLSNQDSGGTYNGKQLGGIGFWSLYWMAELSSYDPRASSSVSRTRTYPHIYQAVMEAYSPPGTTRYVIDGYEGLDYRWRDPNEAPDSSGDSDSDSYRTLQSSPSGSGAPPDTTNAMEVYFDFEASSGNQLVFAHEVLNSALAPSVADINATTAHFDFSTKLSAYIYTPSSYSGRAVRMLLIDGDDELEMSEQYSLSTSGWQYIEWDITDASSVHGFSTSEPNFSSGDGAIDTSGGGERDISFFGFLIEGGGAGSGSVYFDEVAYEHTNPGRKDYVVNEFRYDDPALEFVEIYGPAGTIPESLQLRFFDASDGNVLKTFSISGSIPDDTGTGYGYWVLGDSGVANVDSSTGFGSGSDDLPNSDPSAMQIYNTSSGNVYDSVVYEAYGGLDDLIRLKTQRVTGEGYPWLGRIASGGNASSIDYTQGRYPDGADTQRNNADFSFMPASPGMANGDSITLPVTYTFTSTPSTAFQTFQDFSVADPTAAGLPASANGGNAHRCIDTNGGGVMSVIGDKALGYDGNGYSVEGEIYIPDSGEPAQANGIGICGNHGSAFFTSSRDSNSYEDGYWILYENCSGVNLDDGRPDHAGVFEFVHASHDNMDEYPVELLSSKTLSEVGITAGGWTSFYMSVDPGASTSRQLLIALSDTPVYEGAIPEGGAEAGAFVVGFRENHSGEPVSSEGTWVDNVTLDVAFEPVVIVTHPSNQTVNEGETAEFSVTATGTDIEYQWKKDGSPLSGETASTLTISNSQQSDEGTYTVVVSNLFTSEESNGATLTVQVADWDGDGIADSNEAFPPAAGESNMYLYDSDGDGLSDGYEDANLNGQQDSGETSTRDIDSDGDGISDGYEVNIIGSDPLDPDTSYTDNDGDGVPYFGDPNDNNVDSDGDGYRDSYEMENGYDANNASDTPPLGDLNEDGGVDNTDAFIAINMFLGNIAWGDYNCDNMDCNRDGILDNVDAFIILNYFLGNITYLPTN